MAQYDFGTIDISATNGSALATLLGQARDAQHSTHSGGTRPGYAVEGMLWLDTTGVVNDIKYFDGADDVILVEIGAGLPHGARFVDSLRLGGRAAAEYLTKVEGQEVWNVSAPVFQFGTGSNEDTFSYDEVSNTYTFRADATVGDFSDMGAAIVQTATFYATSRVVIALGGDIDPGDPARGMLELGDTSRSDQAWSKYDVNEIVIGNSDGTEFGVLWSNVVTGVRWSGPDLQIRQAGTWVTVA